MAKILLVEDDQVLCRMVSDALKMEQHTVEVVHDGMEGSDLLRLCGYDLAVIDWELPNRSGVEICKIYRDHGGATAILFLTGKREIVEKEAGFDAGADDYLTKPFDMRELLSRVRALLRRPKTLAGDVLTVGHVVLEPAVGRVRVAGTEVKLQPRELALLEFLMRRAGMLYSAEALLSSVWDTDSEATLVALRSCITKIRKKLEVEGHSSILHTIHGLGYKVEAS